MSSPRLQLLLASSLLLLGIPAYAAEGSLPAVLAPGAPVATRFPAAASHLYGVRLTAGDYARITVTQQGADVTTTLRSPAGQELIEMDGPADRYSVEAVPVVAQESGLFLLEVRPRTPSEAETGGYRIALAILRPATADDRLRTETEWTAARAYQLSRKGRPEDLPEILAGYGRALETWQRLGDTAEEAALHYRIGLALLIIGGRPAEALPSFEKSLALDRARADTRETAKALNQIGRVCRLLGASQRARTAFAESIALWRQTGEADSEGSVLNNLAKLEADLGDSAAAVETYKEALEIFQSRKDSAGESLVLNALGLLYDQQGQGADAEKRFDEALSLARRLRNPSLEADALTNLGNLDRRLGQPQQALEHLVSAFDRYGEAHDAASQGLVLVNLGSLLVELGELDEGREALERALPLLRDPRQQASAEIALSLVASGQGNRDEARRLLEQALTRQRRVEDRAGEAASLRALGFLQVAAGESAPAEGNLRQALALFASTGSLTGQAASLRGLGSVASGRGDFAAADQSFSQALALAGEVGDSSEQARVLTEMARSQVKRGRFDAARKPLEEALDHLESIRAEIAGDHLRASHFAARREAYEMYVEVLQRLNKETPGAGYDRLAFEATERARARGLLDFLSQARVDLAAGDPALAAQERRLRLEMNAKAALRVQRLANPKGAEDAAALEKQLTQLAAGYEIAEARLEASDPRYKRLRQPEIRLAEIQGKALDEGTVLLEYFLAEPRSFLWLVTPGSLASFELPPRSQIEALARRVHDQLGRPNAQDAAAERRDLAELSRSLLSPVLGRLRGKRVVIVADGALLYLPFAALPVPADDGSGAEVPLVVEHEVVHAPSAAVIRELRSSRRDRPLPTAAVAVLADPVFGQDDPRLQAARAALPPEASVSSAAVGGGQAKVASLLRQSEPTALARLPWSGREAEEIAREVGEKNVFLALGLEASRDLAAGTGLSRYRVVHFATHGVLDTERPALSGLALSQLDEHGKPQDGFLRLHDVYRLHLAADLVVLSGCETALGKSLRGEGIVGLTRGFFHAGASQVLASLWPVRDRATAELMQRFYHGLYHENLSPAAALRAAQIQMWRERQWRNPYYWAAFVLQGDWRAW
ncbi:MAG TPA: CHAT domain-containing protein [Thermoanaerobaculia bacterium]|nr:CHAT domain-containing protein [Thermoanaerobaculia bacterium]